MHKIFVYGTLKDNNVIGYVIGHEYKNKKTPAVLNGYHKEGLTVLGDPDSSVDGFVIEVNDEELMNLDEYEGWPQHYRKLDVSVNGEDMIVYQRVD